MNKFLVVGLGNIGSEYVGTRHNIGFNVAELLAKELETNFSLERHAYCATARLKNKQLVILKPTTYMNLSGKAVKYWLTKENIPLENLLVITDDIDLDTAVLRLRAKGSGGSHNGLNNIIETLQSTQWARLRFGIGKNYAKGFQVEYVLSRWENNEVVLVERQIEVAVEMIKSFVLSGATFTMSLYNNKLPDDI